jgi:lipoate-protein ligase A|tara:strand:+ start:55009 stop:55809 length:801 start_codon:yes stop_codon:yes gene_type:complete
MKCRFIDTGVYDAYANMAIDEAILHYCKIPVLRVYGWKPAGVSIGYNQDLHKEINIDYCKKNNIDIVRRVSGGKAVFHDKELTYSFIIPESINLLPREINESYKEIAKALVLAFEKLGIKAEIKKIPERIATSICFNSSNWYELLINGKKISGSAQRRMDGKILQHGSILLDFDYEKNSLLFNSNNLIDNINNLRKRITSLKKELNKSIDYSELGSALKSGFRENFDFDLIDDSLTNEEIILAEKLRKEKYLTEEWNYKLIRENLI